jgi:phosphoenolpyruvate carboxykinase (ATP)
MVAAALEGGLEKGEFVQEPYFALMIPRSVPGVPSELLDPVNTWSDREAYGLKAEELRDRFRKNFAKFESDVAPALRGVM